MPHIQECTADQRVEGILLFLGLVPNQSTDIHEVIATGHFLNKLSYLFIKLPWQLNRLVSKKKKKKVGLVYL